jgi:hypothetical protein
VFYGKPALVAGFCVRDDFLRAAGPNSFVQLPERADAGQIKGLVLISGHIRILAAAMKSTQQKAVSRYRKRQKDRGLTRVEVTIPEQDRDLLGVIAANLRAGGTVAENTRNLLESAKNPYIGMNFKEFLEAAPLDGLDLERLDDRNRNEDE